MNEPGGILKKSVLRTLALSALRITLLAYLAFGAFLFFMQKSILYHPSGASFGECAELADAERIETENGARAYFKRISDERIAVLYHGNAGSACDRAAYASVFEAGGYSYLIAEYAGYGSDARGGPDMERILKDAEALASFVESGRFETVALVGESLGSSVAAYHASLSKPDTLVFIGPAVSAEKRAQELYPIYPVSLLLRERYDTLGWAARALRARVTLIHAGNDRVVPAHHSRELYEKLPHNDKKLVIIDGTGHNTIYGYPAFWDALRAALK